MHVLLIATGSLRIYTIGTKEMGTAWILRQKGRMTKQRKILRVDSSSLYTPSLSVYDILSFCVVYSKSMALQWQKLFADAVVHSVISIEWWMNVIHLVHTSRLDLFISLFVWLFEHKWTQNRSMCIYSITVWEWNQICFSTEFILVANVLLDDDTTMTRLWNYWYPSSI